MSIADDIRKAIATLPATYQPTPRPAIHPRDVSLYEWLYGGMDGPMPGPDPLGWEPTPVKWPTRPLLIDNVIRTAVGGRRRIGHHRAQAVRRLLSRPLFRGPSPHFTVLEDGTVLDHTAWLGHRDVWTESQVERDRRFSAEARMYLRALFAVQHPAPTLKVSAL